MVSSKPILWDSSIAIISSKWCWKQVWDQATKAVTQDTCSIIRSSATIYQFWRNRHRVCIIYCNITLQSFNIKIPITLVSMVQLYVPCTGIKKANRPLPSNIAGLFLTVNIAQLLCVSSRSWPADTKTSSDCVKWPCIVMIFGLPWIWCVAQYLPSSVNEASPKNIRFTLYVKRSRHWYISTTKDFCTVI